MKLNKIAKFETVMFWVCCHPGPSCSKLGQDNSRVSSKFEFRYESLKSTFSLILFVNKLIIGCS